MIVFKNLPMEYDQDIVINKIFLKLKNFKFFNVIILVKIHDIESIKSRCTLITNVIKYVKNR